MRCPIDPDLLPDPCQTLARPAEMDGRRTPGRQFASGSLRAATLRRSTDWMAHRARPG